MVAEQQIIQLINQLAWQRNVFIYSTMGLAGVLIAFGIFVLLLGRGTIGSFMKARIKNKILGILIKHNKQIETIVSSKEDSDYIYFKIGDKEIRRKYRPDQIFMFAGVRAIFIDDENISAFDPITNNSTPITDKDLHLMIEMEKNTALTEMMGILQKMFKKQAKEFEFDFKTVLIFIFIAIVLFLALRYLPLLTGSFPHP